MTTKLLKMAQQAASHALLTLENNAQTDGEDRWELENLAIGDGLPELKVTWKEGKTSYTLFDKELGMFGATALIMLDELIGVNEE